MIIVFFVYFWSNCW